MNAEQKPPRWIFQSALCVLGFALLFILTSVALAKPPSTAPATHPTTDRAVREFTSDQFHFRLKYPANWLVPGHPIQGQVFSARTPGLEPGDARFGVVGLRIATGPKDRSDHDVLMEISASMAGYVFNHGGKKVIIRPGQLGNMPARWIRFMSDHPSGTVTTMYVVAVKNRVEYVFSVAAPAEKFDELWPEVEAMLKSFEVLD